MRRKPFNMGKQELRSSVFIIDLKEPSKENGKLQALNESLRQLLASLREREKQEADE